MAPPKEPKSCPFCGRRLEWHEDDVDLLGVVLKYWLHPRNGCFLDAAEIYRDDVASWNQRV